MSISCSSKGAQKCFMSDQAGRSSLGTGSQFREPRPGRLLSRHLVLRCPAQLRSLQFLKSGQLQLCVNFVVLRDLSRKVLKQLKGRTTWGCRRQARPGPKFF